MCYKTFLSLLARCTDQSFMREQHENVLKKLLCETHTAETTHDELPIRNCSKAQICKGQVVAQCRSRTRQALLRLLMSACTWCRILPGTIVSDTTECIRCFKHFFTLHYPHHHHRHLFGSSQNSNTGSRKKGVGASSPSCDVLNFALGQPMFLFELLHVVVNH